MNKNSLLFYVLPVVLLSACVQNDERLIEEEVYKKLFIDITLINHMDQRLLNDITKDELIHMVYEKHNVTHEMFRYSHDFYESDIESQLKRMDDISAILRNERDKIIELEKLHASENRESLDSLRQRILNR
ncbi:MAG: DUF4296 domain-containing protein [Balneolaceae bacterium]|nr:MAG: DUF4296 domain-containing protein [Balneolaceae bacterium]